MKTEIVTISDSGTITVPDKVRMTLVEIADLFGVHYKTAKLHIRVIEKSGIVGGNSSDCVAVESSQIYPEYYGLDMVIAVAFRVQSAKADMFRKFVLRKTHKSTASQTILLTLQNELWN